MDELEMVDRLAARCARAGIPSLAVRRSIGDDSAVLALAGDLVVSVDTVVDGVHADLSVSSLADFGWRAVATAASDLAAMGVLGVGLVVAVSTPSLAAVDELYDGILDAAVDLSIPVVGGDLTASPRWVVSVTVFGDAAGAPVVTRSGAHAGDALFTTGPLGAAAAALRRQRAGDRGDATLAHRRPVARLHEGLAARAAGATAMCDCSDGLGIDLDRLARASGVGIDLVDLAVADGATPDEALGGGDDYELLFTAPSPDAVVEAFAAAGLRTPIRLGTATDEPSERRFGGGSFSATGWRSA